MASLYDIVHPQYNEDSAQWQKWRDTYEGGRLFINRYLYKLSTDENDDDFQTRKNLAYVPRFAGSVIDEIKNSIYQRTADVERILGANTYQLAIKGDLQGVDYEKSTMNYFVGHRILLELLIMGRVGVCVDNFTAEELGLTYAEKGEKHPFLTIYRREDIRSWKKDERGFSSLLLREKVIDTNEYGLEDNERHRYRLYRRTDEGVLLTLYRREVIQPEEVEQEYLLNLPRIPFADFQIDRSLLKDVCDYQIALMNMESVDLQFLRIANYPLYYELRDPRYQQRFASPTEDETDTAEDKIRTGMAKGRAIYSDKAPGYVNPDPATLTVSMEKQKQLRQDIRDLIHLNLRQVVSTEDMSDQPLEAGLSCIGMVLQRGEQELAEHWSAFENEGKDVQINYPKNWSLETDDQRTERATKLTQLIEKIPSDTYRKRIFKKIINKTIGHESLPEELEEMYEQIDSSKILLADPRYLIKAKELGAITTEDFNRAMTYPFDKQTVDQAFEERIRVATETAKAQGYELGPARGTPEADGVSSSEEKEGKKKRGEQVL